jgi:hypothetical protein
VLGNQWNDRWAHELRNPRELCQTPKTNGDFQESSSDRKAAPLLKYYIFLKYYAAAQVTLCERSELYVFLKQLLNIVRFLKFICSFTLKAISSSKQSQACAGGFNQGIARLAKSVARYKNPYL